MVEVALVIGAQAWQGWTAITVTRSLEHLAGAFDLQLTDRWTDSQKAATRTPAIRPGDACRIETLKDDQRTTLITGFIDDLAVRIGPEHHDISVRGRDRTADLVDCAAPDSPGEWHGATLAAIIRDLCQPFDIPVAADSPADTPIEAFRIEPGESAFAAIERACRLSGLLAHADGRGGLHLHRLAGDGPRHPTALIEGSNITRAAATIDHRSRFSTYRVKGHDSGHDDGLLAEAHAPEGLAHDRTIRRHRPWTLLCEDRGTSEDFQARAGWEAAVRAARSRRLEVTVSGWDDGAGQHWQPGWLVACDLPSLGIAGDRRVAEARFQRDDRQGSITRLTLTAPGAFHPRPVIERTEDDRSWLA